MHQLFPWANQRATGSQGISRLQPVCGAGRGRHLLAALTCVSAVIAPFSNVVRQQLQQNGDIINRMSSKEHVHVSLRAHLNLITREHSPRFQTSWMFTHAKLTVFKLSMSNSPAALEVLRS